MRIDQSKFIATFLTAFIVGGSLFYIFDWHKSLPSLGFSADWLATKEKKVETKTKRPPRIKSSSKVGRVIDSFNGVEVFYNGRVANIQGRNLTADGYNLGLKYQCVEFVKRYYYEFYNHKMPDSYGNAKDFYSFAIEDGGINPARNLRQFSNPSRARPAIGDILVFGPTPFNKFGHVAIISNMERNRLQVIQQNPGSNNPSRQWFPFRKIGNNYQVEHQYVLGWLRKS